MTILDSPFECAVGGYRPHVRAKNIMKFRITKDEFTKLSSFFCKKDDQFI